MKTVIPRVRGTRDFYPEHMVLRNWIYSNIRSVCVKYGYQEWDAPILERLDLYAAKSGDELVRDQAFVFEDRGGSQVALRPELTPSLARMVAQQGNEQALPLRWWSFGPFWRYERPQKGRMREFFQWNVDFLGCEGIIADAEVACVGADLLRTLGLTSEQVGIRVNSRVLMESKISQLGVAREGFRRVFQLIDKLDKVTEEKWLDQHKTANLDRSQANELLEVLRDGEQWQESLELVEFFETVEAMGLGNWFKFDPKVVRGLDYYTGIVFEARDQLGEFRAVFGGGRYDNLVADVGGEKLAATGFAMGDVVVELLARKHDLVPDVRQPPAGVLVTVFDQNMMLESMALADELRNAGLSIELYPAADRLGKQLKYADRKRMLLVVVLGPEEIDKGIVSLKTLDDRKQTAVAREDAASEIRAFIDRVQAS